MLTVNWKNITHKTKRYIQDYDCHWFVIHKDDVDEFYELLDLCQKNDYCGEEMELFDKKFSYWMTGGAPENLDDDIED